MIRPYVRKQTALLLPYLSGCRSILDFGCGDMSLARDVHRQLPEAVITGVDVVDSGARARGINFTLYDGNRLPFGAGVFDATVSYHVFHHCTDPEASLADVMRVTKKTILIVEPVYRDGWDIFFMKILDRIGNGWRGAAIPMPFTFQKERDWRRWGSGKKWNVQTVKPAGVLPEWLPIGVTKLFVLRAGVKK
jgi:SAM-dependent methyltransferase